MIDELKTQVIEIIKKQRTELSEKDLRLIEKLLQHFCDEMESTHKEVVNNRESLSEDDSEYLWFMIFVYYEFVNMLLVYFEEP